MPKAALQFSETVVRCNHVVLNDFPPLLKQEKYNQVHLPISFTCLDEVVRSNRLLNTIFWLSTANEIVKMYGYFYPSYSVVHSCTIKAVGPLLHVVSMSGVYSSGFDADWNSQ